MRNKHDVKVLVDGYYDEEQMEILAPNLAYNNRINWDVVAKKLKNKKRK